MISFLESLVFKGAVIIFLTSFLACGKDIPDIPKTFTVEQFAPVQISKANTTKVFAHYMPWYETPETSNNKKWGMHWTMNTQNPEITNSNGKRQIASHYYPLTGPYASSDPFIIEYHLLLMKYSGIDGVLIDWYGSTQVNDYGSNLKNSEALIEALNKVGLSFAIVYEDRTIPAVEAEKGTNAIEAAQNDMLYIEENYFENEAYVHVNGAPLLLVFGPETFHKPSEWEKIFEVFKNPPTFVTLNWTSSKTAPSSSGEYIWVDKGALANKYATKNKFDVFIGGSYPGFYDFYKEGGWGEGYFTIDHNNGKTFQQNLDLAKSEQVDYLQLITWNDYGEGTMIEPTQEFEFTYLKMVQKFAGVSFNQNELEKIFNFYLLRKTITGTEEQKILDQTFYYFVSAQHEKAIQLIDSLISKQ
ncbi:MAG TPA: glycoside hydrolase family 71/99-like protein [Prolixibacteraceae bacterium]|nr:glycoside hydrolase family 71/99-like protein [Prolixibacteraceae bacterium]